MNKVVKICGAVALAATLVAPAVSAIASEDKTLVFANYRDIRDLNPHLYGGELFAQNIIFEGLIFIDEDGNPTPWLAKDWVLSEDGTIYTFSLREDVTFSDRTHFDANVVKKNFDALLTNGSRHTWLESVRLMQEFEKSTGEDSVQVVDDYTVQISFADAYYPFLIELGVTRPFRFLSPNCFIDGQTKDGVGCAVGTGSYVLDSNVVDQQSTFKRNPAYWGEQPDIETIVAKVIPDNQSRLVALRRGEIDMVYGLQLIAPNDFQHFAKDDKFQTALSQPVSTRMLIMNSTREYLAETEVRQAFQHLTNRSVISERIMFGLETPAPTLLARNIPYADIDLEPYAYSIEKAEALLEGAGWKKDGQYLKRDGKIFEITLSYDSNKVIERTISQYLQSEWSKVGIKLNLLAEEEQAHRDRLKQADFDISFNISWGTPYDPQSFMGAMRTHVYGDLVAQQGIAEKPQIDASILAALEAVDIDERQEHYTYILETLHREAVYIPLTYESNRAIYNHKIDNVGFNPSQFEIPLERMTVK